MGSKSKRAVESERNRKFAYMEEKREREKELRRPSQWCPVGGTLIVGGVLYRCVAVPSGTDHRDCCSGCDFSRLYRNCAQVACSAFDRPDGVFAWYEEIGGTGDAGRG